MPLHRSAPTLTEQKTLAESKGVARALLRFFAYTSAQPPEESVDDLLYLIKPVRLLNACQYWVQSCPAADSPGAKVIAELVALVESSREHRADLAALAAYSLSKTGGISRTAARSDGERIVALLVAHVRALQLAAAVAQRDDASHLPRLTAAFIAAWPDPLLTVELDEIFQVLTESRPVTRRRQIGFLAPPSLTTGSLVLDSLFHTLGANSLAVEEPFALMAALLRPETPDRVSPFRRCPLPPFVRLKALGYDDRRRQGFTAELSIDRWAGQPNETRNKTRLIRHPDSLFVVTDEAFDQVLTLAFRLAESSRRPTSLLPSGQILRWSLRRNFPLSELEEIFFASGGSIAGAFAVAFRVIQKPAAGLRPILRCAVVSDINDRGELLGVDPSTLKAKFEASEKEQVILSVAQSAESAWLLRYRRRIRTAASLDEAVRQCLNRVAATVLRQYSFGISTLLVLLTLTTLTAAHLTQMSRADKRTDFDASEQFSSTMNPAPYSPWQYGWMPTAARPDSRTFILLRRHVSTDGQSTLGPGPGPGHYNWYPPDSDGPGVAFNLTKADLAWPAAQVLWPTGAFNFQTDQMGNYACVRFVAPRDGAYLSTVTYWGASLQNYGVTLYLLEDNHIIFTRSCTTPSKVRRKDAVSFFTDRGEPHTLTHTANLRQGQFIDVVVGLPVDERRTEHATGLLFHVHRMN